MNWHIRIKNQVEKKRKILYFSFLLQFQVFEFYFVYNNIQFKHILSTMHRNEERKRERELET